MLAVSQRAPWQDRDREKAGSQLQGSCMTSFRNAALDSCRQEEDDKKDRKGRDKEKEKEKEKEREREKDKDKKKDKEKAR